MLWKSFAIVVFLTFFLGFLTPVQAYGAEISQIFISDPGMASMPPLLFQDPQGNTYNLTDFKGRYILLNLWATWCAPCVHEMPSLNSLQRKLGGQNFIVLAINEEREGVTLAPLFYRQHGIRDLNAYIDKNGRAPFLLKADGLPLSVLVDPQGHEVGRVVGDTDWASDETISFLKKKIDH